jgi:hypothetical protein
MWIKSKSLSVNLDSIDEIRIVNKKDLKSLLPHDKFAEGCYIMLEQTEARFRTISRRYETIEDAKKDYDNIMQHLKTIKIEMLG